MTKSDILALAIRVETEHPSDELRALVLTAFGSEAEPGNAPDPLTSIDDAARLVPERWRVWMIDQADDTWRVTLNSSSNSSGAHGSAPTEPRARTAAALRALAVERE